MRDLVGLFLHLLATIARLAGPGGARSVVAEWLVQPRLAKLLRRRRFACRRVHEIAVGTFIPVRRVR